jgi:hypothetical protein
MRWAFAALLLVYLGFIGAVYAGEVPEGLRAPQAPSEARGEAKGFSGLLLLTPDADWQQKWETASDSVPHFQEAREAKIGQQVFVLLFFSNPRLNPSRLADVTCDFDIARPDGTLALHRAGEVCFRGMLQGDAHNVYLSGPVIGFTGDPGDPLGEWTVRATLHDNLRKVSVSLRAPLTLR